MLYFYFSIAVYFQYNFVLVSVYSIVVRHAYTLHSVSPNISSTPLAPYIVVAVLLAIFPMLCITSPWLFLNLAPILKMDTSLHLNPNSPDLTLFIYFWTTGHRIELTIWQIFVICFGKHFFCLIMFCFSLCHLHPNVFNMQLSNSSFLCLCKCM